MHEISTDLRNIFGEGQVQNDAASVVSQKFVRYINSPERGSFDCVWRKSAPNYAQDDRAWFLGSWRKATIKTTARTKAEADPSLRLRNGYGQDDGFIS